MSDLKAILERMRDSPNGVRFVELRRICQHYFGEPRQSGGGDCVFKMPWSGNPRVNIQNKNGMAKPYQMRQVLRAIERLKEKDDL